MFYTETTLVGVLSEAVFATRTGDVSMISTLLNKGVLLLQDELKRCGAGSEELKKVAFSLETITMMQQAHNWVALADVLEFEFIPLWRSITGNS